MAVNDMFIFKRVLVMALAFMVSACGDSESPSPADYVFVNGKIFTSNAAEPYAEALAVRGSEILFVGSDDRISGFIDDTTQVIDIAGGLAIPGFMDSHTHIFMGSYTDVGVNLSLADTPEKLESALVAIREDNPGGDPIYARGWQNHLFSAQGPLAEQLDEVFGDRVVILQSVDGHSTWFSSKALRDGGVTSVTPDPEPGVSFFERDPLTNEPLGTGREAAGSDILATLIPGDSTAYRDRLIQWLPRASAAGLTSVYDAWSAAPTELDSYEILSALDVADALPLRVFGSVRQLASAEEIADRFELFQTRYSGKFVRPEAVKIGVDGVPEGHTAFLLTPYVDKTEEDFGHPMMSEEDLTQQITTYFSRDIPVHLHAIGGAAVRMSLDAIEEARRVTGNQTVRATIAHMDFVSAEDIERFSTLNVTPQTSIQWAARDPSYFNIGSFVGMDKVEAAYPVRSLIEAGANQTFGADWPASAYLSTFKPLQLIEAAVTRRLPGDSTMPQRNPEESLSIAEAIVAMTRNTAIQVGESERLGTLEAGKQADIVLLDRDIFAVEPHTIGSTSVRMTMVAGEIVYQSVD